jgi:hypothetical protein
MTDRKVLESHSVNVIFTDDLCSVSSNASRNGPFVNVSINVNLLQYLNGRQYYDIEYKYTFDKGNLTDINNIKMHKRNILSFGLREESMNGDIIFKNDMISNMITYLLMDDDTLEKYSGNSTAQCYRKNIMISLSNFWD